MMNSSKYYFYDIVSTFGFGRHNNQLLCDVIADDPTYIMWCVDTIPNFGMSELALEQIKILFPKFPITASIMRHIGEDIDFCEDQDDEYVLQEEYEEPTYDRYKCSYAQDEMGYSDDDIDTIFDGDPDAYWNID